MLKSLVRKTRSYRRFKQTPVPRQTLLDLVDLARLCPSGANRQPLKYALSCDPERNARVFACLSWAAYLGQWTPADGERPTAFIVVLCDTAVSKAAGCDHGIAAQTIALGAMEKGLGACMVGSVKREQLAQALGLDPRYEILLVIALGEPGEKVVLEDVTPGGDIKYWRDTKGVHHVPKRLLKDIVVM